MGVFDRESLASRIRGANRFIVGHSPFSTQWQTFSRRWKMVRSLGHMSAGLSHGWAPMSSFSSSAVRCSGAPGSASAGF